MLLFWIHLSKETWEAIAVMTDNAAMLQKKDLYKTINGEEEEYNMCQALEELMEERKRGRKKRQKRRKKRRHFGKDENRSPKYAGSGI